jgi:hypothetical protein
MVPKVSKGLSTNTIRKIKKDKIKSDTDSDDGSNDLKGLENLIVKV